MGWESALRRYVNPTRSTVCEQEASTWDPECGVVSEGASVLLGWSREGLMLSHSGWLFARIQSSAKIPYVGFGPRHRIRVPKRLRQQLAQFLRSQRGDETLARFANRIGISDSTLQRLEIGEQNITIDTLEQLVVRLKCDVSDIFERKIR